MNSEEKKQFGERLRNLAFRKNVSHGKIASDLNLSKQSVSLWMTGKTLPVDSTIRRICEYFGCTREYLLYGKEEEPKKTGVSIEELAIAVIEMRDILKEIRDELSIRRDDMK